MARAIDWMAAQVEAQRGTLLLWAPFGLSLGIGAYFALTQEPGWTAPLALLLGAALFCAALRWVVIAVPLGVMLLLAALGLVLAKAQAGRMAAPVLSEVYYGPVTGRLISLDRSASNRARILLDRVTMPGMRPELVPERVRIVLPSPPRDEVLRPGARLMLRARLTPPPPPVEPEGFDFRRHAWFMGLGAIGSASGPVVLATPPEPVERDLWLFALRRAVAGEITARMPPESAGFAAAILTGDRFAIDPADLNDLRVSNLAHLLAISGLHMGLLTGAVFFLVRFLLALAPRWALRVPTKKIAAVAGLLAGLGYLMLSGASIATQRAFIMTAVVLVAVLLDRPALTLRAVAVAALIILCWQPFVLLGPGFQMSFAATTALIAVYMALSRVPGWSRLRGPFGFVARFLLGLTLTSLVAGLATAPISAFHFNQMPRYGLLANILAVPAMGLLVMPAALLTLVLLPLGLEGWGYALMHLGIAHILAVAHWVAGLEGAVRAVPAGPAVALATLGAGGWALAVLRGPLRGLGAALILLALGQWSMTERPTILVDPEGRLVGVLGEEGRVLNRPRGSGFAARVWLENDGDTASQKAAAARRPEPSKDLMRVDLPGGASLIWSDFPDGTEPEAECGPNIILISARIAKPPSGECQYHDPATLAVTGALAFWPKHRLQPLSAREATGDRPWTRTGAETRQ
ncbi:ComEC/Rec2 family competence protein [Oceanibium sediminis]|uniref:ComEC/Rec2 family competence protein n=1 Tax=Oceanibium sediminis TaxID=2026339 RepID=UPI000DD3CE49|nr:ComEC/Rec2 family competence protein [Oceanibium sediminis]